ncbi:MAG: Flp pilus assembly protein CpaB [Deltaproteobacteria bacterium]|nr:Flp pilus assembly protein CpaB [Deltaproteobacteria bacterium]
MKLEKNKKLLVGIASGIIAIILVQLYLAAFRHSVYSELETIDVLVAKTDIKPGSIVTKDNITSKPQPKRYLSHNTIQQKDEDAVIGHRAVMQVEKGEPLQWTMLGAAKGSGFTSLIKENERAISIAVDNQSSVSGLIRPGDHVDILGTFSFPVSSGATKLATITLLQNVTVLATGGIWGRGLQESEPYSYNSLTLAVSTIEAELLTFASERARLNFVLRNVDNIQAEEIMPVVGWENIMKIGNLKQIQHERNIRVIKGRGGE